MKRILILTALFAVLCLCSCEKRTSVTESDINDTTTVVQEESISDKLLYDIESEYEEESKKDEYTTTLGMVELSYKYADKWDAVSTEYYDKIIAVTENIFEDKKDVIIEKLDNLREVYDEYTEKHLDLYTEICNMRYSGGSIKGPLCANKYYELKKEYALELVSFYEEFTFDLEY
ncbi:MAG: hypothetical protein IKW04_02535 [Clostridia bacterium]|nr:hypothetical protein [Clostridia bacterium]